MNYQKLTIYIFFAVLLISQISCNNSTDADTNSNVPIPIEEYVPPVDNRAKLVASLPFPEGVDTLTRDLWGYKSQNNGKNYIIVGYSLLNENDNFQQYLDIIDVSNPNSPVRIFTFENLKVYDIKSWNNYLYTVTGSSQDSSGSIIDMQNPEQPEIVGSFPSAHNIFIDERGYLYSTANSFTIYDLNNTPTQPSLMSQGNTQTHIHDVFVQDATAYTFGGDEGAKVRKFDVSDPANPEIIKSIFSSDIKFSHSGWATSDHRYLIVTDEFANDDEADFTIWDMDPDSPQLIYGFADPNATAHNVMIQGNYAFFSYYSAGFRVFDIIDPEHPELIGELDTNPFEGESIEIEGNVTRFTLNGAWGIYALMNDGYFYLSDLTGLHVLQVEGID